MKFAIIIPDGCADDPVDLLGGRTPLQAANTPHMDQVARLGVVGRTHNVPGALTPASDVATLSLFGYDPLRVYTGRAPLEAAALGIQLGPDDWAIRCNLVTIENGEMRDFTAGHIGNEDGRELIHALRERLTAESPYGRFEFHAGVSYRNLLVFRGAETSLYTAETKTQAPHDIPDRSIESHQPSGPGAETLIEFMRKSRDVLASHPVNQRRREHGMRPATQIWLWGQGQSPSLRPFAEMHRKRGGIISAVDLVRGVGVLIGWKRIDVPGATGYLDTDYAAKGRHAVAALADHDLVCVHVEAPDEASHEGRADAKVQAIEEIDRHIVGPLLAAMPAFGAWRILVCPDHRTTLLTRAHAHGAVPFAAAGTGIPPAGVNNYDERSAESTGLEFTHGHQMMPWWLGTESEK
jgi:2,3-bisphosphoglycerate-independent phosphoglycerate mutase